MLAVAETWQSLPSRRDGQQDPNWLARLLSWLSRPHRPTVCLALLVRLLSCGAAARDSAEVGLAVLHVLNVGSLIEWRGADPALGDRRAGQPALTPELQSGYRSSFWLCPGRRRRVTRSGGWVRAGTPPPPQLAESRLEVRSSRAAVVRGSSAS